MKQYQPLYLKYRPQRLSEIIGQEVVTKTLGNSVLFNKIVHAYLFCGPRGTGKTSTARILAKSLNCESGITLEPCDKCVSCISIINGNSLDVIEIDAASHRKVEDAEDLINRVSLGTYGSRFKIYIIDEVHMLTDHAFNALLKTLEEPPKNVIFVLATTEDYKIIPTIISRCQKLDFKPLSRTEVTKKIKDIAHKERIKIDDPTLNFISKQSNGSLRDAISLLDQISVLQEEDKPINKTKVFELFGTVDRTVLFELAESTLRFDRKKAIDLAEDLITSGKDISEILMGLIEITIDLAKAKIDPDYRKNLSTELSSPLEILDSVKQSHLLKIISTLQDTMSKLRFALNQELHFIVTVMSMLDEDFTLSMTELNERVKELENNKKLYEQDGKEVVREDSKISYKNEETQEPKITDYALDVVWQKIFSSIDSAPTKTLLSQSDAYLLSLKDDLIEIGLSKDMFLPRLEKDDKKKDMILKAARSATGKELKIVKFRILPKEIQESHTQKDFQNYEVQANNDDEFAKVVKELLGAKKIE